MSGAIIGTDRRSAHMNGYKAFTTRFDRVVRFDQLDRVLGPLPARCREEFSQVWSRFAEGLADWKAEAQRAGVEASTRIRTAVPAASLADITVTLLIDQSGSMRGESMVLTAAAVEAAQDLLLDLGCSVEVLGFTTVSWRGGRARRNWKWRFRPRQPGRLCELLHVVYLDSDKDSTRIDERGFRAMLRPDLLKENIDGEAVLWASERLERRPHSRKILLVVSDGSPVDDSTLAANGPDILDRHLQDVLSTLVASGSIQLAALGIGHDVSGWYPASATIKGPEDLGSALIELLGRVLSSPSVSSPGRSTSLA